MFCYSACSKSCEAFPSMKDLLTDTEYVNLQSGITHSAVASFKEGDIIRKLDDVEDANYVFFEA